MSNTDLDFDSVLDLEDQFYSASYNDALREGQAHTLRDGKQFGIQTGFQRFILVGALRRINDILLEIISQKNSASDSTREGRPLNYERYLKSLSAIQQTIRQFYPESEDDTDDGLIQVTNTPSDVEFYEKNIKLIRSKIKSVYAQIGYKSLYPELESTCRKTAGDIPATQINGGDEQDMW